MQRSRLVIGLAAVFAGMTVLLVVVAAAFRSPVVAILAVTMGVVTYFFWYQASGRLRARVRERARQGQSARGARDARARNGRGERGARGRFEGAPGGFGAGPADAGRRARGREADGGRRRRTRRVRTDPDEPTRAEAYAALGLEPDADEGEIRRAYREKVKEVHPDRGGDEEAFKSVTRAYDRLT